MDIKEAEDIIAKLGDQFDSHDFIRLFLQHYPSSYAQILDKHNYVNTAHGEIARFLYANSSILKIRLVSKDSVTPNVFNNSSQNAMWVKTS